MKNEFVSYTKKGSLDDMLDALVLSLRTPLQYSMFGKGGSPKDFEEEINKNLTIRFSKFLHTIIIPTCFYHLHISEYWYAMPISPGVISWAYGGIREIEVDIDEFK